MVFRRALLQLPIVLMTDKKRTRHIKPVKHVARDQARPREYYDRLYVSNNEKLQYRITFEDFTECLVISHYVDWYDPVLKDVISRKSREMFLLEDDNL